MASSSRAGAEPALRRPPPSLVSAICPYQSRSHPGRDTPSRRRATSAVPLPLAAPTPPEFGAQDGSELRLPLADCLVAEDDAALEEHLAEILEREAIAQAPKHDQSDDVRGILGLVQRAGAALVELP